MHVRYEEAWNIMPFLAVAALVIGLAIGNWRRRRESGRLELFCLQIAAAAWDLGYALTQIAGTWQAELAFRAMLETGGYTAGPAVALLAYHLLGRGSALRSWWSVPAFGPGLVVGISIALRLPWMYQVGENGVAGYGHLILPMVAHANTATGVAVLLSLRQILRGQFSTRMRAAAVCIGALTPWVLFSLIRNGVTEVPEGAAPFFACVAAILIHGVEAYFRGIDVTPLARDIVIESMPEGLVVTTVDGRIADFNQAAARMLGLDRRALRQPIETVLAGWGFDRAQEFPAEREHGGAVLEFSRQDLVRWRETMGTVYLMRDVTRAKQIERELRAASETARKAAQAQAEFLANMSHEIRTPLTGILGMNQLLLDLGLEGKRLEYAEVVRDSAQALQVIVNDVLDLSKIEAGVVTIERIPVPASRVVEEAAALFRQAARAKELWLEVEVEPAFPAAVLGDPTRIRQIVANLLSNAVKFTERGGVKVVLAARDRTWTVAVEDTGIGFDPALTERLFARFLQADSSTTRRFGGTGLGLPISRKLARLMGGEIEAVSQPGAGACFTLRLPLEIAPPTAEPAAPADGCGAVQGRVLIAEDNRVNQRLLAELVGRLGAAVEVADNGEEAVRRAQDGAWDLILMDCSMPVMDGYTAARVIREREQGRGRVPIVAVTAGVLDEDKRRCLAAGMDAVLAKPIDPAELRRLVIRVLPARGAVTA